MADPGREKSYLEAGLTAATCVIVEDDGKRDLRPVLQAVSGAGATLVYVLCTGGRSRRAGEVRPFGAALHSTPA